jgi:uncharacterized protein YjcR
MSKKHQLAAEAERLYVNEQMTPEAIAGRLGICEKTVRIWKDEGLWSEKREAYVKSRQQFHEELYDFARLIMRSVTKDIADGKKPDAGRLHMLMKIIPNIAKVKDYEAAAAKMEGKAKGGDVGKELSAIIQEELFGSAPEAPAAAAAPQDPPQAEGNPK